MADRSIVGRAQRVPQRLKVQALAAADSSTSAVQIAEGRSLVGVGMDMVKDAENADIVGGRIDTWEVAFVLVPAGGKVAVVVAVED